MKLLILTLAIVACKAALLPSKSYLPQVPSSGAQTSFQTITGTSVGGAEGNRRPQQEIERNSAILKLDQKVSESGFYYDYKTSNGISAHEQGDASGSKGSFSYIGDDGLTYSIDFIAGKDGFQASGSHLPVAPPTPETILLALQQNAKDEAAGIFDDGQYRPEKQSVLSAGNVGAYQTIISGDKQQAFNPNTGYQY